MDIEKIAQAIEADAGMPLDDLRQSLAEMQSGVGRVTTAEQLLVRSARAKTGLNTEGLRSPAARQSATNASPKPNGIRIWLVIARMIRSRRPA